MSPSKRLATHRNKQSGRLVPLLGLAIAACVACGGAKGPEEPMTLATLPPESSLGPAAAPPPQEEAFAMEPVAPPESPDRGDVSPAALRARDRAAALEAGSCPQPAPAIGHQKLPEKPSSAPFSMPVRSPTMRPHEFLSSEIQMLERLFQATSQSSPDRPNILRRLADRYVELEAAAIRERISSHAANQAAIKYYTQLKNEYPKWCQTPNAQDPARSSGCTDEVLYSLGQELERGDKLDQARRTYLELIQNWPQSRLVPNTYLAFGEMFFRDALGDPSKWAFAEQSYMEVAKYPPPDNRVWGYARYKLGIVYWHKGDFARAVSELRKAIDFSKQYAALPHSDGLGAAARRDIIPVFALAGDPKRAYDFFRTFGDADEKTFALMDELGELYMSTNHFREAVALYDDLSRRDAGLRRCHEATVMVAATHATARP